MFRMSDSRRISIATTELAKTLAIWLSVVGQRRPALLRDLWTRRDERADQSKREQARHELAHYLAEQMRLSGYEVTRRATASDLAWAAASESEAQ
jgi:hypothetical protein